MKNTKLVLTLLSILTVAACNNGGGSGPGGGSGAKQMIPGLTPDGQKVAPLPADKKDQAVSEMITLSVTNKVFFKHLGLSGKSSSSPTFLPMAANPVDMERAIENGIAGRCQITAIDTSKATADANGNVNYSADGKLDGPNCPFTATAKYSINGTSKSDQNSSSSNFRVGLDTNLTVRDAAMISSMDGIQGGNFGGFMTLSMSGRKTGERSYEMDMASDFDITGAVLNLKGNATIRAYGTSSSKSSFGDQKSSEVVNSKNSTMLVVPNIGTIIVDTIVTTAPGQQPVTKYYLNGEEVSAEIGKRFQGEDSQYSIR